MGRSGQVSFAVGALIVPAQDSLLKGLGHDVAALGARALGIVVEARSAKSRVQFPELNLTVWLPHDEMADVEQRAQAGDREYAALLAQNWEQASLSSLVHALVQAWSADYVLGLEQGPLRDLWSEDMESLADYYSGSSESLATYLALGVKELRWELWKEIQERLGKRLLFARFLPAGMHKIEVALYLGKERPNG